MDSASHFSNTHVYATLIKSLDNVDDAIYIKDLNGYYVYANKTASYLIGRPIDKIIGFKDSDLFPAESLKKIIELDQQVINQKQSINTEVQYELKNSTLWFQAVLSPAYSSDRILIGLIGISRDISEEKLATEKIKSYSDELSIILTNSSDAIYRKDLHGRYLFINQAGANMLKRGVDEIIGHTDTELFGAQVSQRIKKTDRSVINLQSQQSLTTKYSSESGDKWFNVSISPAYDIKEQVVGIVGVSQDITQIKQLELQLREKNEQLMTILESSGDAIFSKDIDGHYLFVNKACEAFIGLPAKDIIGKSDMDIFPREVYETVRALDIKAMNSRQHIANDECFGSKGNQSWYHATISPAYSAHGDLVGVIGVSKNMTAYHEAQEELWQSENKYHSLYNDTPAIFITLDVDGKVIEANAYGAKKLGYTVEELKESSIYTIIPVEDRNKFRNSLQIAVDNPGTLYQTERRYIAKDGSIIWGKDFLRAVLDRDGKPNIPVLSEDMTVAKELKDELHFREVHDVITELYNQKGFEQQLNRAIQVVHNKNVTHILYILELENFKLINETCGQKAGNDLLIAVAELIRVNTRNRDVLGRLSGSEFAVLVENSSFPEVETSVEILLNSIQEYKFSVDEQLFYISASIGIFEIDGLTQNTDYALARASNALLSAKELAKNQFYLYDKSDVGIQSRQTELETINTINQALENDQFSLHAQKITSIYDEHALPSYEVLIRMLTSSGAYASPAQFIPILEQHHLAHELDDWVVRHTFLWLNDNDEILDKVSHFSINLSGQSLSNVSLLDKICNYFVDYQIPHHKICFEITETATIAALKPALLFINTLRNYGCQVALDDFGAGLSSFQYLRDLPVDYVKIDGAFIQNICVNESDFMLTRGMNDLVHQMGMKTVAEYVESEEILSLLQTIGVDYAQGYYYGKAEPLEKIKETLMQM